MREEDEEVEADWSVHVPVLVCVPLMQAWPVFYVDGKDAWCGSKGFSSFSLSRSVCFFCFPFCSSSYCSFSQLHPCCPSASLFHTKRPRSLKLLPSSPEKGCRCRCCCCCFRALKPQLQGCVLPRRPQTPTPGLRVAMAP